jgi:hypothetical protein
MGCTNKRNSRRVVEREMRSDGGSMHGVFRRSIAPLFNLRPTVPDGYCHAYLQRVEARKLLSKNSI